MGLLGHVSALRLPANGLAVKKRLRGSMRTEVGRTALLRHEWFTVLQDALTLLLKDQAPVNASPNLGHSTASSTLSRLLTFVRKSNPVRPLQSLVFKYADLKQLRYSS